MYKYQEAYKECLTIQQLVDILNLYKDKNIPITLFTEGKSYPLLEIQRIKISVDDINELELAGGWKELDYD